jgi:hypothetical protein
VAVSATVVIDEHEAGKRVQANTGTECMLNHIGKQKYHATLANVGTSSSSPEELYLASAPAWSSWCGPRPIPGVDIGHAVFRDFVSYDMLDDERQVMLAVPLQVSRLTFGKGSPTPNGGTCPAGSRR